MPVRTGWVLTSLTNMLISLRIQQAGVEGRAVIGVAQAILFYARDVATQPV